MEMTTNQENNMSITTLDITELDVLIRQGASLIAGDDGPRVRVLGQPGEMTVICFCGEPVEAIDNTGWACALGHGEGLA